MTLLMKAQPVIDQALSTLKTQVDALKSKGVSPRLVVLMVGDNPASKLYVQNKQKMCEKIGASFELVNLPSSASKNEVLKTIESINQDPKTHGFIIQLPVQGEAGQLELDSLVSPEKDVDGFHPLNLFHVIKGDIQPHTLVPCTPQGVMTLLDFYKIPLKGKNAVVIGKSMIVGKPMAFLLTQKQATVTLCHSATVDLREHTRRADIVVAAVGKPEFLDASYFNPQKQTVVIDVGINKIEKGFVGDVHFAEVSPLVSALTPVPGGVGPLTVLTLMQNLVRASQRQEQK
jgi:methylenetetrahydrofolate dehydrogenase (NADP+)/methenyltetrahydrofolate cyclohydrolase